VDEVRHPALARDLAVKSRDEERDVAILSMRQPAQKCNMRVHVELHTPYSEAERALSFARQCRPRTYINIS
jgi:hypothetical protein